MPRRLNQHVPGAFYHVTLRGAYRSEVFFAPADRRLLIDILNDVLERFAGKLLCYSSIEDTLQLLVQVGEEPLGRMMLRVARRYAYAIHGRLEHSVARSLPDVGDLVNRLFEMRWRNTVNPSGAARPRLAAVRH